MRKIAMRGRDHRQEHSDGRTLCDEVLNQAHSTGVWGSLVKIPPLENPSRAVNMSAGGGLEPLPLSEEKEEDGRMMLI